ncbi:MAG: DUF86 domain-containing protein [Phototrophicales bacterium]|nr:MAG: DUF86 domain-containing protein [Phototrophicales bacterium]
MKSTRDYLLDCIIYLDDILSFTDGLDKSQFLTDRKTQLAVIRAFEVIGEIIKRIPQTLLDTQPTIDWRAVKGFRDILIHQYDNIDLLIVWDAIKRVPSVKSAINILLANLPPDDDAL